VTFTAPVSDRFAIGDTVKAYPADNWPLHLRPPAPGSTQLGSSAESAVVAADGSVSYTTLTEDTEYFLTKDGSGVYVRIRPDASLPGMQAVSIQGTPTVAISGTVPVSGTVTANPPTSGSATTTSVAAATSSTPLVAANAARKGLTLTNDSTSNCTVKFGTGASSSSYAVPLSPGQYYELPIYGGVYTGVLEAIWTTANGNMRITEW
jgi:hypothetical protein